MVRSLPLIVPAAFHPVLTLQVLLDDALYQERCQAGISPMRIFVINLAAHGFSSDLLPGKKGVRAAIQISNNGGFLGCHAGALKHTAAGRNRKKGP